jgi:hypothetical protein
MRRASNPPDEKGKGKKQMNIGQIGFLVRYGVSALVVAFLLGYSARYEWGLSRDVIRFSALGGRSDYRDVRGDRFGQGQVIFRRIKAWRVRF